MFPGVLLSMVIVILSFSAKTKLDLVSMGNTCNRSKTNFNQALKGHW